MGIVTSACVAASDRVRPGWSALVAGTHLDRDIRRGRRHDRQASAETGSCTDQWCRMSSCLRCWQTRVSCSFSAGRVSVIFDNASQTLVGTRGNQPSSASHSAAPRDLRARHGFAGVGAEYSRRQAAWSGQSRSRGAAGRMLNAETEQLLRRREIFRWAPSFNRCWVINADCSRRQ